MKFVDVKNDVAFRKIFGNENRKEVLISFLNAVLFLENEHEITDVEILTPYQLPEPRGGKVTIVDIKAKDQGGKDYIVEMQVAEADGFDKRVLYYASKSYSSQIERGDLYEKLNPTFFIGILDFEITQNTDYLSRHKILDIKTGENLISDIEFNFIELPKFNKTESELKTIIEQWIYFIKNAENLDVIPGSIADEGLKNAYEDAAKHNWTKVELEAYDYVLMREQDERGRFNLAMRRGIQKAVEQAEKKAEKKAAEQVKKAVNQTQKAEKETIALNLLKLGLSVESIAQSTGLTIEEVQKLQAP
jgi:predicted transposase/invertase (TIGR01784 family)